MKKKIEMMKRVIASRVGKIIRKKNPAELKIVDLFVIRVSPNWSNNEGEVGCLSLSLNRIIGNLENEYFQPFFSDYSLYLDLSAHSNVCNYYRFQRWVYLGILFLGDWNLFNKKKYLDQ